MVQEKERLEKENIELKEKLAIFKVNFQSLLATAKQEIVRKDATIQELRKEKDNFAFRRGGPQKNFDTPKENTNTTNTKPVPERPEHAKPIIRETNPRRERSREPSKERSRYDDRASRRSRDRRSRERDHDRCKRSGRENSKDRSSTKSNHGSTRDRVRERSRDRESSRRDRNKSPDRSRNRSAGRDSTRSTRDRSRDRKRSNREQTRERSSNETSQRRGSDESRARDSPGSSASEKPAKKLRLEAVPTKELNKDSTKSFNVTPVTTTESRMPPDQGETPRAGKPSDEPLLTSFAGSLERLKKSGILINTDVFQNRSTSPAMAKSPESTNNNLGGLNPSDAISEEMAENALRLSGELKSSPSSSVVSSVPSFHPTMASAYSNTDDVVEKLNSPSVPQMIDQQKPTLVHPHMNLMPAESHLPMMVIPRDAVPITETNAKLGSPRKSQKMEKAQPPPKPKIQTVSAIRDPYPIEEPKMEIKSDLTVETLERINQEQENNQLEYLRTEMIKVAGPEILNDPQLLKSFERKEKEQKRIRAAAEEKAKQAIKDEEQKSSVASDKNTVATKLTKSPTSVAATKAAVEESDPVETKPVVVSLEKTPGKCIIMGNSKYNYTEDADGTRVLVVSRIRKKKRVAAADRETKG